MGAIDHPGRPVAAFVPGTHRIVFSAYDQLLITDVVSIKHVILSPDGQFAATTSSRAVILSSWLRALERFDP